MGQVLIESCADWYNHSKQIATVPGYPMISGSIDFFLKLFLRNDRVWPSINKMLE